MTTTSIVLLAWMAGTVAHAGQPQRKVTVYLLDRANESYMTCIPAQALAVRMFAAICIALEWAKGKPTGESAQPPIIIEVVTGAPETFKPGSVAHALPYEGSHITVLLDRIENIFQRLHIDFKPAWPRYAYNVHL